MAWFQLTHIGIALGGRSEEVILELLVVGVRYDDLDEQEVVFRVFHFHDGGVLMQPTVIGVCVCVCECVCVWVCVWVCVCC